MIDRGRVYAIGVGGLIVALDLRSGRRLWEREVGGGQTPWIAGDWLFVQTADQSLAAIGARTAASAGSRTCRAGTTRPSSATPSSGAAR